MLTQEAMERGRNAPRQMNPILKAKEKPASLKLAIRATCGHCVGCTEDHVEPNWKEAVRNCTAYSCPLINHRPYKNCDKKEGQINMQLIK